eukprot:2589865-Karenia_brevis.AAC.1
MDAVACPKKKMMLLLTSTCCSDWVALGKYLWRVRQIRRRRRQDFYHMNTKLDGISYTKKKAAWQAQGRYVCRHGMFYMHSGTPGCACMSGTWGNPVYMPAIDMDLKSLVA